MADSVMDELKKIADNWLKCAFLKKYEAIGNTYLKKIEAIKARRK